MFFFFLSVCAYIKYYIKDLSTIKLESIILGHVYISKRYQSLLSQQVTEKCVGCMLSFFLGKVLGVFAGLVRWGLLICLAADRWRVWYSPWLSTPNHSAEGEPSLFVTRDFPKVTPHISSSMLPAWSTHRLQPCRDAPLEKLKIKNTTINVLSAGLYQVMKICCVVQTP